MKRFELIFTALQLPIDYLMLILAGVVAYNLRFASFVITLRPVLFGLPWTRFWPTLLTVASGWVVIFALSGLYTADPNRKFASDVTRIVNACSTGFAAIAIYVFISLQKFDSRFLVLTGWILSMIFVVVGRLLIRGTKTLLHRAGVGLRQVAIIGREGSSQIIAERLIHEPRLGYAVAGTFTDFSPTTESALLALAPDELIYAGQKNPGESLRAVTFANQHHIVFKYSADLFETITSNMAISTIAGIPIIELRRTRLVGWGRIMKRFLDIVGSIFFMIVLSPFFAFAALGVLIESGFPIIYRNERVGQHGRKFFAYKFRSMKKELSTGQQFGASGERALAAEAELIKNQNGKTGPVYKIVNDPRVTKFGRILRRFSLDELPQFVNVLKGEMSLVGPRPHQPREVAGYEKDHTVLFAIKPGITGLAQISGRSDLTFEEEAKLDTFYVEKWSLYLDLIIIIKTPFVVLRSIGAW